MSATDIKRMDDTVEKSRRHPAGSQETDAMLLMPEEAAMAIQEFSARLATGEERRFADYRGKVLLIVNVASRCGFTPQHGGLQAPLRRVSPARL